MIFCSFSERRVIIIAKLILLLLILWTVTMFFKWEKKQYTMLIRCALRNT